MGSVGTATVGSSTINLTKTIVGAGMLAIPFVFKNDGVLVGVFLTVLAATTSGFGLFVLSRCSKVLSNPRTSSFFTLCMITYPSLSPLFDIAMIVQCFGVGLSYLVLIGDIFPSLFGGERNFWILTSSLIVWPLCSLKKMDSLRYSSIIGLLALSYIFLLIIAMFFINNVFSENGALESSPVNWLHVYSWKGLFSSFSIVIFAYTGSMNLFSIINELEDNSMTQINKVINSSIGISSFFFLSVGIAGYLTYGSNTLGNILLNYDQNSPWIYVANFCLASMLVLSFPLLFHPLRIAVNNLFVYFRMKQAAGGQSINLSDDNEENENQPEDYYFNSSAASLVATATRTSMASIIMNIDEDDINDNDRLLVSSMHASDIDVDNDMISDIITLPVPGEEEQHVSFPNYRFYAITFTVLPLMYIISLRLKSFAFVLALVGATGSTSMSFTLPGLFGYKLIGSDSLAIGQMISKRDNFYKKCSLLLVWFGIIVMVLSLYVTMKYGGEN
ncbi:similar to Saccharomyces cerevisiae YIL088C AVT7 Putative transporter, member of a family of seven Saccharomyces cerevisiae genes (AVT1-7) related to vesicular GABA-glycine transporters [Maudiozyma barnettii]|uniref:Similar to Saccharomyces cerevisiae YIL088C AVT7 Putative transporter, member of a family of seven Saccharomyces cerevisiae genes (AVT1-7) related to vesicular GABA-glycine transporters n=1 Tax=Maudiozyma barnettii TaxID=61262 RepID=A0A8H2VKJ4_9SACH|nr:Avt7p [Kazachstania barnettii]CAB4257050.1 similar to Saccharomyces cerevisiae YIL088C AVT7 Putative transporter, member of a family of seven Saccharomyces cerevisiae genes (AVT1-7) related to vesicular GABA-glycine transporters [Kazachstania barnettii]CAD1779421.1 similar to Saccharomyces cerevisiae YIL088C AVT7 Putative transporter, member of a family of seven Saccharomyces cerevisiae genes (AVT1-7) related to vesicular GABA-glycine transporters [Kazachstania barnettii]